MLNQDNPQDVFVVIPAFNESKAIKDVVNSLLKYHFSVVLVDDGSEQPINELIEDLPIYLLRHKVNLGQGAALQTGIDYAISKGARYIITFDADGQHSSSDINKLLAVLIKDNADVALGSRFLKGSGHNMSTTRKVVITIGRYFNLLSTGLFLSDAHNGLRALTKNAALQIKMKHNGMAHATEILNEIKKHRLKYIEVPVNIVYTDYSRSKGQSLWNSFRIFFDILLNKISK